MRLGVAGIIAFSSVGGLLFGLDIGYIGPITSFRGFCNSVNGGEALSSSQQGFVVGVFSIGAVIASWPHVSSFFIDGIGRRDSMVLGSLVFCLGSTLQAAASGLKMIYAGRFVSGLAIGLLSAASPLYQSEVAPSEWRGAMVATYNLSITAGIMAAFWLDHVVNHEDDFGWRIAIWLQLLPGIILGMGLFLMPRSPRWLAWKGRIAEASQTLHRIRDSPADARHELDEIQESLRCMDHDANPNKLWEVMSSRYVFRLVCLGMSIMMLQQLCGMNAFMYYGMVIFDMVHLPSSSFNTIIGLVNFLATFPGIWAVDRFGRTRLLQCSATFMTIACMLCGSLGIAYVTYPPGCVGNECMAGATVTNVFAAHTIVACIFVFIFSFAYGWGPIAWVYCAEIFPLEYRSFAMGLTTCSCWIGNYVVAHFTPVLLDMMHFWTFILYGGFCVVCMALAVWLPETRGIPLENISPLFETKLGAKFEAAHAKASVVKKLLPPGAKSQGYSSTA
jgi:sugar porter (SP) family MFS transporter